MPSLDATHSPTAPYLFSPMVFLLTVEPVSGFFDDPSPPIGGLLEDATPSDGEVVPIAGLLPPADERYSDMKVLVCGATGGTGKAVVKQLSAQGLTVRALVRDAVKATSLPGIDKGVEIVEGDVYKFENCVRAMPGISAVICCTGPTDRLNLLAPFQVDYQGTENLVAAAKQAGVKKFIYVSSIGADDIFFPLNAFGLVLFWKKQAELAVQRSGMDYTIIRPGGLLNEVKAGGRGDGGVIAASADSFGLPPRRRPGSILRSEVAEGCVVALVAPEASNKVVEVITEGDAPRRPWSEVFASVLN